MRFSRETEPIGYIYVYVHIHIYMSLHMRRAIIGTGYHSYRGLQVPQPAVCMLETRKAGAVNSVQVERPHCAWGGGWGGCINFSLSLKAEDQEQQHPREEEGGLTSSREQMHPPFVLLFYSGPQ